MEGNRPTQEIVTPIGKQKVVVKQWLTGRERQQIEGANYQQVNAQPKQLGKHSSMEFDKINAGAIVEETMRRTFEQYVVSVDGKTDGLVDVILDMHEEDTDFIFTHLQGKKKPTDSAGATS